MHRGHNEAGRLDQSCAVHGSSWEAAEAGLAVAQWLRLWLELGLWFGLMDSAVEAGLALAQWLGLWLQPMVSAVEAGLALA